MTKQCNLTLAKPVDKQSTELCSAKTLLYILNCFLQFKLLFHYVKPRLFSVTVIISYCTIFVIWPFCTYLYFTYTWQTLLLPSNCCQSFAICRLPRPGDLISVLTETFSTGHWPIDPVLVRSRVRLTVRSGDCVCFFTGHEGKLPQDYFRSRWSNRNDSNRCYPPGDYPHTVSVIATVLPLGQTFWRSRYCYQYCLSVCLSVCLCKNWKFLVRNQRTLVGISVMVNPGCD